MNSTTQKTLSKKVMVDLFLKVPLIGYSVVIIPYSVITTLLEKFGIGSFAPLKITFNGELLTGRLLFWASVLFGPLASLTLTLLTWMSLALGFWIYLKFSKNSVESFFRRD